MSRSKPAPYEQRLLAFVCGRCGAPVGEWCKGAAATGAGRLAAWALDMHSDRYRQLRDLEKAAHL